jgi:hypothetical protein
MTSDVAREGTSGRSSQWRDALIAEASSAENSLSGFGSKSFESCCSFALTRASYSSSVSSARVPRSGGRSNGTPIELSLVYVPRRSGSPHGVRRAGCATMLAIVASAKPTVSQRPTHIRPPRRSDAILRQQE